MCFYTVYLFLSFLSVSSFRLSRDRIKNLVQMLPCQKPCGWSHQTEVLVTLYWLTCKALCKATADILAMPSPTVGRTVQRCSEEKFSFSGQWGWRTSIACLAGGSGAFWSAVRCHVRIFPRAAQQEKYYVTPLCCSRVPVTPEVHFWVFTMPVQHQWSLSSISCVKK